jgi:hypothetical protein
MFTPGELRHFLLSSTRVALIYSLSLFLRLDVNYVKILNLDEGFYIGGHSSRHVAKRPGGM